MTISRSVPLAALAALTALVPAAAAAPSVTARPACATAGIVVWLDTTADHAAGSAYYRLELTNLSGRACTLRGYPGVSAVGLSGRRLGRAASRDAARAARAVTLRAGASASATLQIVDVLNFPRSTCGPVRAAGLRVYPPNARTPRLVPFPFLACSRAGPAFLRVRALQAG